MRSDFWRDLHFEQQQTDGNAYNNFLKSSKGNFDVQCSNEQQFCISYIEYDLDSEKKQKNLQKDLSNRDECI